MSGGRRLTAIMFTDLEGYTPLSPTDEAGALQLLEAQERLLTPVLSAFRGRKVKSIGDGLLMEFPNVRDAVEAAVEFQISIREYNKSGTHPPLRMRIGIRVGDVEARGDDILGDAVNIAARIEPLCEVGGVCLSATTTTPTAYCFGPRRNTIWPCRWCGTPLAWNRCAGTRGSRSSYGG